MNIAKPNALVRYDAALATPIEELGWPDVRFRLLELSGEPMDIIFRRYAFGPGAELGRVVDDVHMRHESHDGIGAMTAILEERGWTIPTMPAQRSPRPGLLARLVLFRRYVARMRGWPHRWRTAPDWDVKAKWPASAIAIFDEERTAAYMSALLAQGASATSGILSSLDRRAAASLLTAESPRKWMVPVNMRAQGTRDYGNVVTSILVPFPQAMAPADVHREMRDMLARNLHWGSTVFASVLRRLSLARKTRILARFDPKRAIFGFVTNIGAWPPESAVPPPDEPDDAASTWVIIPPVGRRGPLACTMLTWRGKLAVVLRAHGCLRLSDADVKAFVQGVADDVAEAAGGKGRGWVFSDESTRAG